MLTLYSAHTAVMCLKGQDRQTTDVIYIQLQDPAIDLACSNSMELQLSIVYVYKCLICAL